MTNMTFRSAGALLALLLLPWVSAAQDSVSSTLNLHMRRQVETAAGSGQFQVEEREAAWNPQKTAIIICDMWNQHWCKGATERVAEMAPRMNEVVKEARKRGVFIIHAPSDTMKFYQDTPQRRRAQEAPKVPLPPGAQGWRSLDPTRESALPIDDSDGGCDDLPHCPGGGPWKREIEALEVFPEDAVTDSIEAYNLLQQRRIDNVIVMGVHANMCVLGRPFSIRQMVKLGKNVVLMRDMTDTMFNSRSKPYVSHFAGTDLIVNHIERYWCPSIASSDILGGQPFRFKGDKRPKVVFMIGEGEYHTKETLPEFAARELGWRGIDTVFAQVSGTNPNDFPGLEALKEADLLVVSVRRLTPSKAQMALIREHLAAGKPLVGIRTASHAFDAKAPSGDYESWSAFDREVLGGHYEGHYNNKPPEGAYSFVKVAAAASSHPVMTGIGGEEFRVTSHLYKNRGLAAGVTPLMTGRVEGRPEVEPVAWVNTSKNRRVFYTSLGNPDDFGQPFFRRLLLNGILWAMDRPVPPELASYAAAKPSGAAVPAR